MHPLEKRRWIIVGAVILFVWTVAAQEGGQGLGCSEGYVKNISQYGITWFFDTCTRAGRFVNGDWWVVGPVNIIQIFPGKQGVMQDGTNYTLHGSMVNPEPVGIGLGEQGYDSRAPAFSEKLSVAAPLTLQSGQSLISSMSWRITEGGCPQRYSIEPANPLYSMPYPPLRSQAVLTALDKVPLEGTFRPPYVGKEKHLYTTALFDIALLPDFPVGGELPDLSQIKSRLHRPWIDHITSEQGEFIHASENMNFLAGNIADHLHEASLVTMMNISDSDKKDIALSLTQIGIDFYGILKNGGGWGSLQGANGLGRKWTILYAGILLGEPEMQSIGDNYTDPYFGEDSQTFYILEEDSSRFPPSTRAFASWDASNSSLYDHSGKGWWESDGGGKQPSSFGKGFPNDFYVRIYSNASYYYTKVKKLIDNSTLELLPMNRSPLHDNLTVQVQLFPHYRISYADWGENHAGQPQKDFIRETRTASSGKYAGAALSAYFLNAKFLWNHDPFFDYTDYYMEEQKPGSLFRSSSSFIEKTWDIYRKGYWCLWRSTEAGNPYAPREYYYGERGECSCKRCDEKTPPRRGDMLNKNGSYYPTIITKVIEDSSVSNPIVKAQDNGTNTNQTSESDNEDEDNPWRQVIYLGIGLVVFIIIVLLIARYRNRSYSGGV